MSGRLILVPNGLDFGVEGAAVDLREVVPLEVIGTAARLTHWVAENAKTTRAFLKRVDAIIPLAQPLQSLNIVEMPRPPKGRAPPNADSHSKVWPGMLAPAQAGHDIGLISEAGLPAIADPGAMLVAAAHAQGVPVLPLSGPSSLLLALSASGLNGQSFAFVGYLPVEAAARNGRLRELESLSRRWGQTQLMIETPYRNQALLDALLACLQAQTLLSVSCGLTLPGAWTRTGSIAQWRAKIQPMPDKVPAVFALLAR